MLSGIFSCKTSAVNRILIPAAILWLNVAQRRAAQRRCQADTMWGETALRGCVWRRFVDDASAPWRTHHDFFLFLTMPPYPPHSAVHLFTIIYLLEEFDWVGPFWQWRRRLRMSDLHSLIGCWRIVSHFILNWQSYELNRQRGIVIQLRCRALWSRR